MTTELDPAIGVHLGLLTDPQLRDADHLELTGLVAALLLLGWYDQEETEQVSETPFDERPCMSALPAALRWPAWRCLRGSALTDFLDEQLLPWLRGAERGAVRQPLTHLRTPIEAHSRIGAGGVGRLLDSFALIDFSSPEGRIHAQFLLEIMFQHGRVGHMAFVHRIPQHGHFFQPRGHQPAAAQALALAARRDTQFDVEMVSLLNAWPQHAADHDHFRRG